MTKTLQTKFEKARAAYLTADQRMTELEIALSVRYQRPEWASKTETKRLVALRARRDRAGERIHTLLEAAPRDWKRGVPAHWICTELSFEDAFRPASEPLSVVPPKAYGY